MVPVAARRIGASMPVEVDVAGVFGDGGADAGASTTCVALGADPGVLRPVFPTACGMDIGGAGDGTAASPVRTCLAVAAAGGMWSGSTLAIYTPHDQESVITLVGGVYKDANCSGSPIATVAVVIDIPPPPQADAGAKLAPDGGTGPGDAAEDSADKDSSMGGHCAQDGGDADGGAPRGDAGSSTCHP